MMGISSGIEFNDLLFKYWEWRIYVATNSNKFEVRYDLKPYLTFEGRFSGYYNAKSQSGFERKLLNILV